MQRKYAPGLIEEIMQKSDLVEEDLAKRLGTTQQTISNYRLGNISRERYEFIAKLQEILAEVEEDGQRRKLPRNTEVNISR